MNMPSLSTAIEDAELLILLVGHKEFKDIDPRQIFRLTTARLVVDAVGGWDEQSWSDAGFTVYRLGVGKR